MSKDKKRLVPVRRFKEFENADAWEQRKLGDMGNVITGNTPSTKDKSNWTTDKNKGHIWITPTDINRKVLFDSERYLSDKGWLKARKIPKNSVLITSIASIGKNAINGIDAAFNQQINALILQNNNYYFVLSLMDKEKKRFEALAGQTATPIINKSTFSSFQLQIPSENEQNKIGNFFKKIDNLITLHQRKLDKLKRVKSAYLTEMFPAEGEREPKRRFPGFTGAWEQRKLGELAEIVRGASPRPISDPKWFDANSDVGWLRISDVTNQNGRIRYLEQHISKLGQEKTRVITEPHLLLSIAATVGKPLINYVKTGVHDGFLIFLNPKFDLEFMYQWLEMFRPEWNKYGQPGSQVNLNSDLVKNQKIAIPSKEEQQKISNFFNEMDSLIALHQRKPK